MQHVLVTENQPKADIYSIVKLSIFGNKYKVDLLSRIFNMWEISLLIKEEFK